MSLKKHAKFFKFSADNKRIRFIEIEFQLLTNFREMLVVALLLDSILWIARNKKMFYTSRIHRRREKSLINTKNLLSDIALSPIKTSNGELT